MVNHLSFWLVNKGLSMKEVAVFEAKMRLSELLAEVEAGEQVTITRRGQAVARLVGVGPSRRSAQSQRQRVGQIVSALKERRQHIRLDIPVRQAIDQGRD